MSLVYRLVKGSGLTNVEGDANFQELDRRTAGDWQTVTPDVSNAVPTTIDFNAGRNVILESPADNTQSVTVPSNMPDGQVMEILLVGGGASGSWPQWDSGSPSTPGWVFPQGAAPTAPVSALNARSTTVRRRGVKYVAYTAGFDEVL